MDLNEFQSLSLRSCSPTSPELAARYLHVRSHVLKALEIHKIGAENLQLDNLKKFIFYGRFPERFSYKGMENNRAYFQPERPDEAKILLEIELVHSILGIATEVEEFIAAFLKGEADVEFDIVNLVEEFGDMLWYIAQGLRGMKQDMEACGQMNLAKLAKRYKDKFNDAEAINRDVDAERAVLEQGMAKEVKSIPPLPTSDDTLGEDQ